MRVVLSIAGFDPSGGAGILADIKTFAAFGCFGTTAITSVTFQNTIAVYGFQHQTGESLRGQIEPIVADFDISAVKLGMLPTPDTIAVTAETIEHHHLKNVVLDPVIRSTSGYDLIDDEAARCVVERLFRLADLVTPNMAEAERLTQLSVKNVEQMEAAALRLQEMGARAVLVKGGHLSGEAVDVLVDGSGTRLYTAPRIETSSTHGTGCTLSSAIAALLAQGHGLRESIERAKEYLTTAIRTAPGLGHGAGPLNHFPRSLVI